MHCQISLFLLLAAVSVPDKASNYAGGLKNLDHVI